MAQAEAKGQEDEIRALKQKEEADLRAVGGRRDVTVSIFKVQPQPFLLDRSVDNEFFALAQNSSRPHIASPPKKCRPLPPQLEATVNKQEQLSRLRHDTRDYLLKQMQDKADRKAQALELKKLQASVLVEDTRNYDETESKKVKAKKLRNFEHQKELQAQIREKEGRTLNIAMSQAEEAINKDLLQHVFVELEKAKGGEVAA